VRSLAQSAGSFRVDVSSGTSGGTASLVAWKDAFAGALEINGAEVSATVSYAAQRATFTVPGTTGGAEIILGITGSTLPSGGSMQLRAPNGAIAAVGSFTGAGGFVRLGAPSSGPYTLEVTPNGNGTGSFVARLYTDVNETIVLDESKVITLPLAGQRARISFTAAAGDMLGIDFSEVAFGTGSFHILGPGNTCCYVFNTGVPAAGTFQRMGTAPTAGTYTIVLDVAATGSVRLKVWKETIVAVALDDPAPVTLSAPNRGQHIRFSFQGIAGKVVGLEFTNVAFGGNAATYFVLTPSNSIYVFNTGIPPSGLLHRAGAAPVTGTYIGDLTPSAPGSVALRVWKDVEVQAILDQPTEISIAKPGQIAKVSFDATTSDFVGVQWKNVTFPSGASFFATRPEGSLFVNTTQIGPSGETTLRLERAPQTGTYVATMTPHANATGSITFTPWKDVTVPLTIGAPTTISIPIGSQQGRPFFTGTTGQALSLALSGSTLTGNAYLLDPAGTVIFGPIGFASAPIAIDLPALPREGTYTVQLATGVAGAVTVTVAPR
jgi:hypothetical protein